MQKTLAVKRPDSVTES